MAVTYDWDMNLRDANNTLSMQFHAVPPGSLVLDVGCATGFLGEALRRDRGCEVIGLELDDEQAELARERGLVVVTGDITAATTRQEVRDAAGRPFDVIVLGDVLEHLADPFAALRAIVADLLDPAGLVVTSLPNVAHGSIRLDLLRGRFRYTPTGLLDRTHLQLFTWERIQELFAAADLEVVAEQRSYFPVVGTEGRIQPGEFSDDVLAFVERDLASHVYQYVNRARPAVTAQRTAAAAGRRALPDARPLLAMVLGDADDDAVAALRMAVPGRFALEVAGASEADVAARCAELDDDHAVLLLDPGVPAAPRWVAPLLHAFDQRGTAYGVTVVDRGRVVASGFDADGRGLLAGADAEWPLASVDHRACWLRPPLVARAAELRGSGPVRGHLLSTAPAAGRLGAAFGPASPQALAATLAPVTLVVADRAPHQLSAPLQERLLDMASGPGTVVYRWAAADLSAERALSRPFEEAGIALFGGEVIGEGASSPMVRVPGTAALARGLDAARIIWLEPSRLREELVGVLYAQPAAERLTIGPPGPGIDRSVAPDEIEAAQAPAAHVSATPERLSDRDLVPGRISVIVPAYGNGELTEACIDAIRATTAHLDVEVVVVDNASPDDTVARLSAREDVVLIANDANLGFARAVNQGLERASGEHVCLLNNDALPLDGWLDEMLAVLDGESVAMVAPRSDEISGLQRLPDGPMLATDPDGAIARGLAHASARRGRAFALARLVGFCVLLRTRTLIEHGALAVPAGLGNFEDDELCRRLLRTGGRLLVADGAVVLHHGSAAFRLAEVDYTEQMAGAARSLDAPIASGGPISAVVLSDGNPEAAARTALSALHVVDHVAIFEADRADEVALACAQHPAIEVHRSGVPSVAATPHAGRWLVLAAGEAAAVTDPVEARVALWEAALPAAVAVGAGVQSRLVAPGDLGAVGAAAAEPLGGFSLTV